MIEVENQYLKINSMFKSKPELWKTVNSNQKQAMDAYIFHYFFECYMYLSLYTWWKYTSCKEETNFTTIWQLNL